MKMDRIIVDTGNEGKNRVVADLRLCSICQVNFSISDPCTMCEMRIDKERELGRRMTQEEWDELFGWLK